MILLLLDGGVDDVVELREFFVTTTQIGLASSDAQRQSLRVGGSGVLP